MYNFWGFVTQFTLFFTKQAKNSFELGESSIQQLQWLAVLQTLNKLNL